MFTCFWNAKLHRQWKLCYIVQLVSQIPTTLCCTTQQRGIAQRCMRKLLQSTAAMLQPTCFAMVLSCLSWYSSQWLVPLRDRLHEKLHCLTKLLEWNSCHNVHKNKFLSIIFCLLSKLKNCFKVNLPCFKPDLTLTLKHIKFDLKWSLKFARLENFFCETCKCQSQTYCFHVLAYNSYTS